MWLPLILFVLAVDTIAADYDHGWKAGNEYIFLVRGRTLTGLDQLEAQYTGILTKGLLTIQAKDPNTLRAKLSKGQYASIHKSLPEGWDTEIPDQQLELQEIPLSFKPFEIKLKHGVIRDLIVEKDVPTWEVNILKSVVSQLQIDTFGENAKRTTSTQVPVGDEPYAAFKAMEDSVAGKCEVQYDITPLPDYVLQDKPELVPRPELRGDGHHIDIMKTKNFSRCDQRMGYHFGITPQSNWQPGSNNNGRYLTKSSTSRIVISGSLKSFTIQSSVTTNLMFVNPRLYDEQIGTVVSVMNLTLVNARPISEPLPLPQNPESTGNLVYTYNNPFSDSPHRRAGRPNAHSHSRSSKDRSDSSSEEESRHEHFRHESHSSSSEEDSFWQPRPKLDEAPENPLLPYFVGNAGKAIGKSGKINIVDASRELVEQMAVELEDPSSMPAQDTLEKFMILSGLIRTMSRKQIEEFEKGVHPAWNEVEFSTKPKREKKNAWTIFRDAVTQAGTGPALLTIKDWIERGVIEAAEAVDVIAQLSKTARTPTAEYVEALFELATKPEVKKQEMLHSTAILTFAILVRQSQICNRSLHSRYPVHSFGHMVSKHDRTVLEKYIPYLSEQLHQAVKDEDSPRIQTYAFALGDIAHPNILAIFEPYLEGKHPVTTFQRTVMVASLSKLAEMNPKLARSVLYKIYLNTLEAHEVRCMAVYLLMKTDPPLSMLQRMAEFTNYDANKHVNSAVRTTILWLSELKRPETSSLSAKAAAAKNLLSEVEYDDQYSQGYLTDDIMQNRNLAYTFVANYIGSEDSPFLKALYMGLHTSYSGLKLPPLEFGFMLSSIKALADSLFPSKEVDHSAKMATEKIAEILNIVPEAPIKLEGNMFANSFYGSKFFAFDKHTFERIPESMMHHLAALQEGRYVNDNKFLNYEVIQSFPTETGFPFVTSVSVPVLIKSDGALKMNAGPTISTKADMRVAFAEKFQGRIGFVVPFEHQHYMAGIDMNFQTYLPASFEVGLNAQEKKFEVKVWPIKGESNARVLHMSVVPYTSKYDISSLRPVQSQKNTHKVHTRKPDSITENFPLKSSKLFKMEMEADDLDDNMVPSLDTEDPIGQLIFPWSSDDSKYRKIDIYMNLDLDHKQPVKLSASFVGKDVEESSENSKDWKPKATAVRPKDNKPDSEDRKKEFLKEAAKGIQHPRSHVLDVQLEVPGKYHQQHTLSLAWATSNIEDKYRSLFYWNVYIPEYEISYEVCAAGQARMPQISPLLSYDDATKMERTFDGDVEIRYGETCLDDGQIRITAKQSQSEEFKKKVQESVIAKKCKEEMKHGNKALSACKKARADMLTFDDIEVSLELDSKTLMTLANKAVHMAKDMAHPNVETDTSSPRNYGKNNIDMQIKLTDDLKTADIRVFTSDMDVTFPSVDLEGPSMPSTSDDMNVRTLDNEDAASCVLDHNQAETFDDKSYPLKLGKCWHVVMTTYPKRNADKNEEFVRIPRDMRVTVLAREIGDNKKEVKMKLGDKEVRFGSHGAKLEALVDGKKVDCSNGKTYREVTEKDVEFEILEYEDKSIRLISDKYDIDVVYDGERIQTMASDKYRNSVRGICGNYDGESENDFMAPKNCLLKKPEEFLASYALTKEDECEGPSLENARKADKFFCAKREYRTSNVISDREAGRSPSEGNNWGYHRSQSQEGKRCMSYKTRMTSSSNEICFTTRPVPFCAPGCSATETKNKEYPYHCVPDNESSRQMKKRVEEGATPDLSQKPVSFSRAINVPLHCA
ncbi:hypothetical protein KM043_002858 [Ampulex compressa]|nr:hypothetical protein KM043_002858 [Ampulex compressa]